jgi:hypothetical protein
VTRQTLLSRQRYALDVLARTDISDMRRLEVESGLRRINASLGQAPSCRICGRALHANQSTARGIGPVCAHKIGA